MSIFNVHVIIGNKRGLLKNKKEKWNLNLFPIVLVEEYMILLATASGPESQFWSFSVQSGIRNSILKLFFFSIFFFPWLLSFSWTIPFSSQKNQCEVIPSTNFLELRYSKMNLSCMMLFCSVSSIFQGQIPAQKDTLIQFGFYTRNLIYSPSSSVPLWKKPLPQW